MVQITDDMHVVTKIILCHRQYNNDYHATIFIQLARLFIEARRCIL